MAQLIKLENYISRYQKDPFHYPGQFIRLKQENWRKLVQTWEQQLQIETEIDEQDEPAENLSKWKQFFHRREQVESEMDEESIIEDLPATKDDLKQYFLNMLLPFQLKWASTTIQEMSFLDRSYYDDLTLKYFLQRFPDTFLLLYRPVFQFKNAAMDGDIILITPIGINIIRLIEIDSTKRLIAGDDRTWYSEENNVRSRLLSPMLSLKRTEKIIRSILSVNDLEIPIEKVVLSRTNSIDFNTEPYLTTFIGKEQHEQWLSEKRNFISPLKHNQLKIAEALLQFSDTISVRRPEWKQDDSEKDFNL
ncbi:hypothetical protein GCM10011351_09910 [Paraliobacillus quinghaiensis]|uniref:NERD domain-containing protein n=1 Tax=Paraliobacillus quinghaiensis TaxID=470815 RepID=A0A917TK66_9BACI|nr:NERD domain-containing protein [Paraliobacillus quinghaiensis]GGM26286.1 hypothetical protein GCM10011351_09910 [Paraliobacillus quinghaiensis]